MLLRPTRFARLRTPTMSFASRASHLANDVLVKTRGRALRVLADTLPERVVFQHGPRRSRAIALTFDDGPGPMTAEYLDVLDAAGAKATFFVIGNRCEAHAEALAETARRGHEVAGHGWSHTPFTKLATDALAIELEKTAAVLPSLHGPSRMVRPPYGRMTPRSLFASYRAGFSSAMWSFDPLDWAARSAEEVVASVDPSKLQGGDIVLLHEERRATLDALPAMIDRIQKAGLELVTVSDLVRF